MLFSATDRLVVSYSVNPKIVIKRQLTFRAQNAHSIFIRKLHLVITISSTVYADAIDDCEAVYENEEGCIKVYELCESITNKNNPISQ